LGERRREKRGRRKKNGTGARAGREEGMQKKETKKRTMAAFGKGGNERRQAVEAKNRIKKNYHAPTR
jgi:hypothetical protein